MRLEDSLDLGVQLTSTLQGLDVGVASNVLATDEYVRHGSLVGQLVKGVLDFRSVFNVVQFQNVRLLGDF